MMKNQKELSLRFSDRSGIISNDSYERDLQIIANYSIYDVPRVEDEQSSFLWGLSQEVISFESTKTENNIKQVCQEAQAIGVKTYVDQKKIKGKKMTQIKKEEAEEEDFMIEHSRKEAKKNSKQFFACHICKFFEEAGYKLTQEDIQCLTALKNAPSLPAFIKLFQRTGAIDEGLSEFFEPHRLNGMIMSSKARNFYFKIVYMQEGNILWKRFILTQKKKQSLI